MAQNYFGFKKPANKIVVAATDSCFYSEYKLENATGAYAGRLAMKGTNADDVVVSDAASYMPHGWIGFEQSFLGSTSYTSNRPATVDTIWTVNMRVPVLKGGGFWIVGSLAPGFAAQKGDMLIPWGSGTLAPAIPMLGGFGVRIGFTKSTSEADTNVDLPSGVIVTAAIPKITTNAGSSTLDVGILSSEAGGDADGFIDGASCATAGWVKPINVDATAANNTVGVFLVEDDIKSADSTALYASFPSFHVGDGTATSVTYTTSNHTVAGDIYLVVQSPGIMPVATAEEDKTAASSAQDLMVKSLI